ncbi:MAG: helix-turn-helix domain-containing protein, partial [Puniceicoccaceae bacterium]
VGEEVLDWWDWLNLPPAGGILRLPAGGAEDIALGRIHESLGLRTESLVAASSALRWSLVRLVMARTGSAEPASAREAVVRVEDWMREHSAGQVNLPELAARAGLSQAHFSALFKRIFDRSPMDHFLRLKVQRACGLLLETNWPVKRIAQEVSVADPLYFSRMFHRVMGCSPRHWRQYPFRKERH